VEETELENRRTNMFRIGIGALACVAVVAMPAEAKPAKSHKCTPHAVAYAASGTLESQALTQSKGADTTKRSDDRYSGSLTVDVKRANHHGATGSQTYTVQDARVRFYDADHDGTADAPKAGDRVKVKGRITQLGKKCDASGFTPTVTVRKVELKPAKAAKA
jgi:phage baseplate assembly protein gpV